MLRETEFFLMIIVLPFHYLRVFSQSHWNTLLASEEISFLKVVWVATSPICWENLTASAKQLANHLDWRSLLHKTFWLTSDKTQTKVPIIYVMYRLNILLTRKLFYMSTTYRLYLHTHKKNISKASIIFSYYDQPSEVI